MVSIYGSLFSQAKSLSRFLNADDQQNFCCICKGQKFEDHHVFPRHLGGPNEGPTVPLCANHHKRVHQGFNSLVKGKPYEFDSGKTEALSKFIIQCFTNSVVSDQQPRKLVIEIPDKWLKKLHLRKVDKGYSNVVEYIKSLIARDISDL